MKANLQALFLLSAILFAMGCATAKKSFEKGDYDETIVLAAKDLRRNPENEKAIKLLYDAYIIAQDRDQQQLNTLLTENLDANSEAIFLLYQKLDKRQMLVKEIPSLDWTAFKGDYPFEFQDYSDEMAEFKTKAVSYLTISGKDYLAKGDRFSARDAYALFERAKVYDPGNAELVTLSNQAASAGMTYVAITWGSESGMTLPATLESYFAGLSTHQFESGWNDFLAAGETAGAHYEYRISVSSVSISPERVSEKEYEDVKVIEDGFVYVLDSAGRKVTDSKGKPVTKPVYKEVRAKVKKIEMSKECYLYGRIYLLNTATGETLVQDDIYGSSSFYHVYGFYNGDERALSDESKKVLKFSQPVFFPTQDMMISQASGPFITAAEKQIKQRLNYVL